MAGDPFGKRSSGILLHPTSLPGPHGVGDVGPAAHQFVDFLRRAGQSWWQMLPIGPPGGGNSPYDSPSAFAGSPLLISLELLARDGLLEHSDIAAPRQLAAAKSARYDAALHFRMPRLRSAFEHFEGSPKHRASRKRFERFREHARSWLADYALFSALAGSQQGASWTAWPRELRSREPAALARASRELFKEIRFFEFLQYLFDLQWRELHAHATANGIFLLGDIPMFVAHNGADVWAHQQLFHLDRAGNKTVVAGVPPDPFSKTGQLWGNALYDWRALAKTRFSWWVDRFETTLERFDALRIDHFIGLYRCWEVPADAKDARRGRFVQVPGQALLDTVRKRLGKLPFVAEDLGLVTPEVAKLRDHFALPGMAVLQFGFGDGGSGREHEPHRYGRRLIAYTGTHDNDTFVGWLSARATSRREAAALKRVRTRLRAYLGADEADSHWQAIRQLCTSAADTVIFPLQDLLGLGSQARMNVPGVGSGNWEWRVSSTQLRAAVADRMATLCELSERAPARP
ncbi:MAG TPA: 4-alpha-glucanotransferase [Polyangiaceae bacterium]